MMFLAIAVNNRDSNLIPLIVGLATWSKAYHCELVFSDGVTLQSTPKHVGYVDKVVYDRYKWVLLPLPQISGEREYAIRAMADSLLAKNPTYDYVGAIFGRFIPTAGDSNKWYCSELCRYLLKDDISAIKDEKWITPDRIWEAVANDLDTKYPQYDQPLNRAYRV